MTMEAVSAGSVEVAKIAALLNSTASSREQIRQAAEIIDFRISPNEQVSAQRITTRSHEPDPKEERILKWVLTRLTTEKLTPNGVAVQPETHLLTHELLQRLPRKTTQRLLAQVDLFKTISQCLQYTMFELAELGQKLSILPAGPSQERLALHASAKPAVYRLQSIGKIIKIFERPRDSTHRSSLSIERASILVGNGLWCILLVLSQDGLWSPSSSLNITLVQPLLTLFDHVRQSSPQQHRGDTERHSSRDRSMKISQHCLLPALGILTRTNELPILEIFILQYCINPFKHSFAQESDTSITKEMFEGMRNSAPHDPELDPRLRFIPGQNSVKVSLPLLVKLSGQSREATFGNGVHEDSWNQHIFAESMKCLGIESLASENGLDMEQITSLNEILLAFESIGASPGLQQLSQIILRCTESDLDGYTAGTWKTIKTSLEIQHEVVTSDNKQATDVLSRIFAQIDRADEAISKEAMKTGIEQDAFNLLLVPLLEAFAAARKMTKLLPDWEVSIEQAVSRATTTPNTKLRETFWEAPPVQYAIQQMFVQSLTEMEFLGLIEKVAEPFLRGTGTRPKRNDLYRSTVILSTLLKCCHETHIGRKSAMQQLSCHLYVSIAHFYRGSFSEGIRYQLLQILNQIIIILYHVEPAGLQAISAANTSLLPVLSESLYATLCKQGDSSLHYEDARAACKLLVNLYDYEWSSVVSDSLVNLTSLLNLKLRTHLETVFRGRIPRNGEIEAAIQQTQRLAFVNWDIFSMTTAIDLVHACVAILAESIWIWDGLSMTDLKNFTGNIYASLFLFSQGSIVYQLPRLSSGSNGTNSSQQSTTESQVFTWHAEHQQRWKDIWDSLKSNESDSEKIFQAIRSIQLSSFLDSGAELLMILPSNLKLRQSFDLFAIMQLEQSNFKSFSKDDRSKIVDHILAAYRSSTCNKETSSAALRFLRQVLQTPTRSAASLINLQTIWLVATSLEDTMDIDDVNRLCAIVRIMTRFSLEIESTVALQNFRESIENKVKQSGKPTTVVTDVVLATAIAALENSDYPTSHEAQMCLLEHKLGALKECPTTNTSAQRLLLLQSISIIVGKIPNSHDLREDKIHNPFAEGYLEVMERDLHDRLEHNCDLASDPKMLCWIHATEIAAQLNGDQDDVASFHGIELDFLNHGLLEYRANELVQRFKTLSVEHKTKVLQGFSDPQCTLGENQLAYLIELVSLHLMAEERTDDMGQALRNLSDRAYHTLEEPQRFKCLLGWLEVYTSILKNYRWAAKQEDIDSAIARVKFLARANRQIVEEKTKDCKMDLLLLSIMEIISALFLNHRQSILGRWHLVVDALNGILACFFTTYPGAAPKDTIEQPTWLADYDKTTIGYNVVSDFSRLLSDICDPISRVPSTNNRHGLNDVSKSLRAISGQHMKNFLASYCALLLKGKMIHQDALKPGIYSIFDAMNQDVRTSCHESLNAEAQAIFKNLYEDWKKSGKWSGN